MTGRLTDKVAFITGAARGQGRAHAVRMAREGADIIAVDIAGKLPSCVPYAVGNRRRTSPKPFGWLKPTAAESSLRPSTPATSTDSARPSDDGVATLGRLDIIVANAGIAAPQAWNEITPESFRDVMDVNVTGTWNTVMAGAEKIIEGGRGGSIILISSAAGQRCSRSWCTTPPASTPSPGWPAPSPPNWASTRSGSTAFTRDRSTPPWGGDMVGGDRQGHGDQSAVGQHAHAVSAELGCGAGRYRRRRVLAGQRRIAQRHRGGRSRSTRVRRSTDRPHRE